MVTVPMLPKRLAIDYQVLAPIVDYSDAKLMEHVSVTLLFPTTNSPSHSFPLLTHIRLCATQDIAGLNMYVTNIKAFTRNIVSFFGHSCQWPEEKKFVRLCERIVKVIDAKKAALPPKMPSGEESWTDVADRKYLQDLYRNAAPASNFGWDDVGAGGSDVQSQETPLDYSFGYPYPELRSIDYCTIPDKY